MKVLPVAAESTPFARTGAPADAVRALLPACPALGAIAAAGREVVGLAHA